MKKLLIFFAAFWVSFMTIYSIYYYKVSKKLDQSVVANAKDLPNTEIGNMGDHSPSKNLILNLGVMQVLHLQSFDMAPLIADAPAQDFVSYDGVYSKAGLEKFYEDLVTKFPNHPPMDFNGVKEGDQMLVSYFFENARLSDGFRVSAQPIDFKGKQVKALQYHPTQPADTARVSFYKTENSGEYALKIKLNDGAEQIVMYCSPKYFNWQDGEKRADSLILAKNASHPLAKDESVLAPEIDFTIVNDLVKADLPSLPVFQKYKLVEERIKLKISPPKEGGPIEADASHNTKTNFVMNGNLLVYMKEKGEDAPYAVLYIVNPEILKPAR